MNTISPAPRSSSKKTTIIIVVVVLIACICLCVVAALVAVFAFDWTPPFISTPGGQDNGLNTNGTTGEPKTWLVLLYSDADSLELERDMFIDFNEAELVGSSEMVTVVAQLDRYQGEFSGDGDWTGAKRYLVNQDNNLDSINSQELADLGEIDMGKKQTLVDFATWSIQNYPADKYVLIMSDHGAGWAGGWTDSDAGNEDGMRLQDIDEAMAEIISNTGIGQFELIGFDACLMGQLEVMSAMAPHAKYAVASEETEPSLGWAYAQILDGLTQNPGMTGQGLGSLIVNSYIAQDVRVVNDQARSIYLQERNITGDYSAQELSDGLSLDVTLSAIDLSAVSSVDAAFNELIRLLADSDQSLVAEARAYTQSYTNVFGEDFPAPFVDLGNFAGMLKENAGAGSPVSQAADQLLNALGQAVVAEKHGDQLSGSSGLTFYYPNSDLFWVTANNTNILYTDYAGRFAAASLWDNFLAYHYTGLPFDPDSADLAVLDPPLAAETDFSMAAQKSAPLPDAELTAPGAGVITIAPLSLSADTVTGDDIVTLTTEVAGTNIAYIYYYVFYYYPDDGSYLAADMGFIEPGYVKEVNGVVYPDWGTEAVTPVTWEWDPTLFYMSDGNEANDQFAFFEPDTYGATSEEDLYSVRGMYTFLSDGSQVDAIIKFNGVGDMQSVYGFFNIENGAASPREIIPQPGDTFTITDQWFEFTSDNPDGEFVDYTGGMMTFGDSRFTMERYYPFTGDYLLGVIVEDMNGNYTWETVPLTIVD
jgi:hypothetical protein